MKEFREELAGALDRVHKIAKNRGGKIVYTNDISRSDREFLVDTHWLQPIVQGWYMLVKPELLPGESSYWYANFWDFISSYLEHHYDQNYCLSAENSLDIHTNSSSIPKQVIAIVKERGGFQIKLPFDTSLLIYKDSKNFPAEVTSVKNVRVMTLPYALCKVTPTYFLKDAQQAEIALRLIHSPDELLAPIFDNSFKKAAERLIGAYTFLGDDAMAEGLKHGLRHFGIRAGSENPFEHSEPLTSERVKSPYMARITAQWKTYRDVVIKNFPEPPGIVEDKQSYLSEIEEIYKQDAYHSLSIEGFEVNEELILRVKNNQWNPEKNSKDKDDRNALAARGYYEAFQEVKKTIEKILGGNNPGEILEKDFPLWFQSLFAPSVRAGILKPSDLLGYRKHAVYIRRSRHIPLPKDSLRDAMEAFFSCLKAEPHPAVRAILGHFFFVYIHPYMDGNGRIGRFLMNSMLASGGYPWTIIRLEHRTEYLSALEEASVEGNIDSFAKFVANETMYRFKK